MLQVTYSWGRYFTVERSPTNLLRIFINLYLVWLLPFCMFVCLATTGV